MNWERRQAALEPAFLLHSRAFRETSALLEVLTDDHGRIGLVARGARGPKSRLRGVLQPFTPLLVSWQARGELGTLTGAEADGHWPPLRGGALASGFYLNELLLRLLRRDDPHPGLLEAYRSAVRELSGAENPEPVLRLFEKRLLDAIGYGLPLEADAAGDAIDPARRYSCRIDGPPHAVAGGSAGVSGEALLALAAERDLTGEHARELRGLMRSALDAQLGGRPLKSRELYRQLAR